MKKVVNTGLAPQAIGPYSQAIRMGNFLFLSGQIPLDPVSGQVVYGGIEPQTHQVLNNIRAILEQEGLGFSQVVKTTVFLQDMEDFASMNKVYAQYFTSEPPARSCVQVAALPRNVSVEIEVIAIAAK
ncbi:endoribonuclease l-psp [Lucifera butyrica]|uniref:Endoribonuclease l-psp n=1 Tax=Lucifera butyrica TaxID=1351585 RepID=A0A498R6V5_9FIRM|nr:RidA family protein [Lucifera butyrica]VBB06795.1 endoribonuclease l-psp [Lucifera butyrica]